MPGFELENSGPDTILSCMHQPIQPKSLGWGGQFTYTYFNIDSQVSWVLDIFAGQTYQWCIGQWHGPNK